MSQIIRFQTFRLEPNEGLIRLVWVLIKFNQDESISFNNHTIVLTILKRICYNVNVEIEKQF